VYYNCLQVAGMRSTVTVSLSKDLKRALDRLSRDEGVSRSDLVRESVREYLFFARYRHLRRRLVAKARRRGVLTDQDVFDRIS
jgi:metal-responsive CopG/Arc/MetJ family transcriptional regulator